MLELQLNESTHKIVIRLLVGTIATINAIYKTLIRDEKKNLKSTDSKDDVSYYLA